MACYSSLSPLKSLSSEKAQVIFAKKKFRFESNQNFLALASARAPSSVADRTTGCVCEKIAQNVAQRIFIKSYA
jgi:hypothetical protein